MASGLLYDHQILLPSMLVLLLTFTLGSKYLLPAKKFISITVVVKALSAELSCTWLGLVVVRNKDKKNCSHNFG